MPCSRVTIKELIYKQICNDIKTDIQWLTNNTDNAYHPIVTHDLEIGINTDASLLVWDIKYTTNPS